VNGSSRFSVLAARFVFRFASRLIFTFTFMFGSLALAGCGRTEAPPQSYQWIVSDAGVGPVAIGMRSDDLQGIIDTLGKLGECVYASPIERVASGFSRKDLLVMLVDGVVARVDVIGPSVATAAGAHVGDSEARIKQLYPASRVEPHKYTDGHYLVVETAPQRRLVFETDGTRVTRYRSGVVPAVEWVEGCS
jgi:hypothetical protein